MTREYVSTISRIIRCRASTEGALTLAAKLKPLLGKYWSIVHLYRVVKLLFLLPFFYVCSRDGQYIISGSEDNFVYVWKTHIDMSKMPSRRDRNEFYESFSSKYMYCYVHFLCGYTLEIMHSIIII